MSPSISSNAGSCGSPESGICMDTCMRHMLPRYDEYKEVWPLTVQTQQADPLLTGCHSAEGCTVELEVCMGQRTTGLQAPPLWIPDTLPYPKADIRLAYVCFKVSVYKIFDYLTLYLPAHHRRIPRWRCAVAPLGCTADLHSAAGGPSVNSDSTLDSGSDWSPSTKDTHYEHTKLNTSGRHVN